MYKSSLICFGSLVFMCGCVPNLSGYRYTKIYGENVAVVATSMPSIPGLYFSDPVPSEYKVIDDEYTLTLSVELDRYWPTLKISTQSSEGQLNIKPVNSSECARFYHNPENVLKNEAREDLYFEWSPPFYCKTEAVAEGLFLKVSIYDKAGVYIGENELYFDIVKNGVVLRYDAL